VSDKIFSGNLQEYIKKTRSHLLDINTVGITLPANIISYLVLGKLMKDNKLEKIIDKCVLLLLTFFLMPFKHGSKKSDNRTALILTLNPPGKFNFKIIHYCANGNHSPKCTIHQEPRCFEKYWHLCSGGSSNKKNASASFAHASVFVSFVSSQSFEDVVINSAALNHMLRNQNLFTFFIEEEVLIKTGNPDSPISALGHSTAEILTNSRVVELHDCLLVPKMLQKLISLVQLIKHLIKIVKTSSLFEIFDNHKSLLSSRIIDTLLYVKYTHCPKSLINTSETDHLLWNHQLGHPGDQVMK
jgi:hypothetical protein